jgi:Tol biopolymer transport system component
MHDLREVFEMVTKQTEPDLDSWKKQEDRQRQRSRNRRIGAIVVAAAAAIAIGAFALASRPGSGTTSVTNPPAPSVPFVTTPPIGAQLVAPDGTPVRQFPGSFWGDEALQLSPDGKTIAFFDSSFHVHSIGVDGTNEQTLAGAGNSNYGDAVNHIAWSPDGSQIAYPYNGDIYVMNADGSDQHAITHATGGMGYFYPVWSSRGTIAMWGAPDPGVDGGPADSEIYIVPATGGAITRLTRNGQSNIEPSWSPDGTRIAYWDGGALLVMQADGSNKHSVYGHEGGAWAPTWSPDGKNIAFIKYVGNLPTERGGAPLMQLRTVELATGNVSKLHMHSLTDLNGPQWVSDGEILINRYN